jgi:aspartyl-tRNA(Asn)/glutamyl-tRNA(Gln) amidotransferase subunit A
LRTFEDAAMALRSGKTTSRDLVEASLARIAEPSGQGGAAFVEVYAKHAREAADAMDRLHRVGRAPGRYAGIPISLKDLFDVAGEVTRAGSVVLKDAPPAQFHAIIVQRLLAAGLIPVGRTNMTEFAFSGVGINPHHGTPLSPWDRATGRIPGGSSSGAAVSVTDGFAFAGIGTDTGGSCRIPAALCGIAGFKPTARRIPLDGVLPLAPTLDSVGVLGHSVACCAALDAIMAGTPERTLHDRSVAGLRLALPTNLALDHLDDATEAALDRAVARLDAAGALIDRRHLVTFDENTAANARGGFAVAEAYAWHKDLLARSADLYDPRVGSRIAPGAHMAASDYILLSQARARVIALFAQEMEPYDALILPTVPIKPPALAEFAEDDNYKRLNFLLLRNPSTINFFDGCAISLPCHAEGAPPAGLMLAAPGMHDARLLGIAAAVERVVAPAHS